MTFLFVLVTLAYCFIIGVLIYGWNMVPEKNLKNTIPQHKFSIIIPFRDEAENLAALLNSITQLNYPTSYFEVIMVDDASMDGSIEICNVFKNTHTQLNFKIIKNIRESNSPKKDAIACAINLAKFEYIITTDADCIVPLNWLQIFNEEIIKSNAKLIAAPVKYHTLDSNKSKFENFLHTFQELDFMSLQLSGAGGFGLKVPFMCNGANLCYKKNAFLSMDGFKGNTHISSGDDVFLLQKFRDESLAVTFLKSKEAIVSTKSEKNLSMLISQRIRWASKSSVYTSNFARLTGLVVLVMNIMLLAGAFFSLLGLMPFFPVLLAFLFKFNIDFIAIYSASKFFKKEQMMRNYLWCSILYPIFTSYVAVISIFKGFEWKGRIFAK